MSLQILNKNIGPIGYGLMGLTARHDPLDDETAFAAIKAAIDSGCNYFDGGEFYGPPHRNSLTLLRSYFEKYPEDASKVVLNIKGGMAPSFAPDGSKEGIAASIDRTLSMLGPIGRVDQFEAARKDPNADYEQDTLKTIQSYVEQGKIGAISASEISAATLRSAAKAGFKITALEVELSLFQTEPLTNGIVEACAELDIPILAYSPLGKGSLTGQIKSPEDIPEDDFRRSTPRYQGENFWKNLELVAELKKLAEKKGCTPGQIAINWLLSLSKRPGMPTIIPIPGSTNAARVKENAKIVDLTDDDVKEIEKLLASFPVTGDRYPAFHMTWVHG